MKQSASLSPSSSCLYSGRRAFIVAMKRSYVLLTQAIPFLVCVHAFDSRTTGPTRRSFLESLAITTTLTTGWWTIAPPCVVSTARTDDSEIDTLLKQQPFKYSEEWIGTLLPRLDLAEAVDRFQKDEDNTAVWPMGRWPDPALRIPAEPVAEKWFGTDTLKRACDLLVRTARRNEAVGLAAQQCGVNARIVVLEKEPRTRPLRMFHHEMNANPDFIVMVNPTIIDRSPEIDLRVWNERCLVLPPDFVATVLRDAAVTVQYQSVEKDVDGSTVQQRVMRLTGESARALQHELDHDRGILVTDHVDLSDLPDGVMRRIERPGHEERMMVAFDRYVYDATYYLGREIVHTT